MRSLALFVSLGLLLGSSAALAADKVEFWTRKPGEYGMVGLKTQRLDVRSVTLSKLKQTTVTKLDLQYEKKQTYRGVSLKTLITQYKPRTAGIDLALLHFENGMIIPLRLDNSAVEKVDAFVAVGIKGPAKGFSADFPSVAREKGANMDRRPTTFSNNKVVVSTSWFPELPKSEEYFSPWRHVDSLKGIEFANRAAYERQFDATSATAAGVEVFRSRCQFCHGVNEMGARFGWDFLSPMPLHTYKTAKKLQIHVGTSKLAAMDQGLMMPVQRTMSEEESKALLEWTKALKKKGEINPYAPPK